MNVFRFCYRLVILDSFLSQSLAAHHNFQFFYTYIFLVSRSVFGLVILLSVCQFRSLIFLMDHGSNNLDLPYGLYQKSFKFSMSFILRPSGRRAVASSVAVNQFPCPVFVRAPTVPHAQPHLGITSDPDIQKKFLNTKKGFISPCRKSPLNGRK